MPQIFVKPIGTFIGLSASTNMALQSERHKMKRYNQHQAPKVTFTSVEEYEWNMLPHLDLLTDDMLWKDMIDAAELEEYEIAICYRDELIKRGKLGVNKPLEETEIL